MKTHPHWPGRESFLRPLSLPLCSLINPLSKHHIGRKDRCSPVHMVIKRLCCHCGHSSTNSYRTQICVLSGGPSTLSCLSFPCQQASILANFKSTSHLGKPSATVQELTVGFPPERYRGQQKRCWEFYQIRMCFFCIVLQYHP